MINRRKVLVLASLLGIPAASGCADYPPHREISIAAIAASQTETGWQLELTVANDNTISTDEANFHSVTVHVYSKSGNEVGEQDIGTLSHEYTINDGKDVTIACSSFPYVVTFSAQESPCEKNTEIMIGRYDGTHDGAYVWTTEYRECDEGLPPEFSTPESVPSETTTD